MANITLFGASYTDVPACTLPKTGGGTVRFTDTSPTTATDSDVANGKVYFKADGSQSTGTASGSSVTVESFTVTSAGTHTAPTGKAYSPVIVGAGGVALPTSISSSGGTGSSSGTNVIVSKTVSVTPTVTAGYISSASASNVDITMQATDANFLPENIKSGISIFGKTGTYSGGGSSDFKSGTLTVSSNVNTSTNTKITDTTTIGFTPSVFVFARSDRSATSNHINAATFTRLGTSNYYIRTRTRYSSNALSTSGDTNNWTTQTSGYLYFNSNTVYFRSSSSYILASGTWNWYAIK